MSTILTREQFKQEALKQIENDFDRIDTGITETVLLLDELKSILLISVRAVEQRFNENDVVNLLEHVQKSIDFHENKVSDFELDLRKTRQLTIDLLNNGFTG